MPRVFRTPVDSLYVGGNEPTLDLRLKLTMQYIVKLKANIDNPAYFSSTIWNLYDKSKTCIKSIGFRIQKYMDDSNIPLGIIKPVSHSKIPPWKTTKTQNR